MRMAAHCGCPETDSFSGRAITSSSFANSRRFFCGCFVIMMAVIQIAILHSNLFDMQCNTAEDLIALAKTEGVELTKEEANAYLDELSECELKDGDLKHVAGGAKDPSQCRNLESRY